MILAINMIGMTKQRMHKTWALCTEKVIAKTRFTKYAHCIGLHIL